MHAKCYSNEAANGHILETTKMEHDQAILRLATKGVIVFNVAESDTVKNKIRAISSIGRATDS